MNPSPARISVGELVREAYGSLVARPGRSLLTAAGTIIGVACLVAVLGLAATANGQVAASFDALQANTVVARDVRPDDGEELDFPFDPAALGRVERLHGVVAAGAVYSPITGDLVRGPNPAFPRAESMPIFAVTPGIWKTVEASNVEGRLTDVGLAGADVTVIGRGAADRLGIGGLAAPTVIEIGDRPFTVIGIVDDVERKPELIASVMVPMDAARMVWGEPSRAEGAELLVATEQGAALQVAEELPWAASPGAPDAIDVERPPDPRELREHVSRTLQGLLTGLGVVALSIGTFGIANAALVSVMERRSEIALRRALGATQFDVAKQIGLESALLGALGGLIGATLGLYSVIAVSLTRGWAPIVNVQLVIAAPVIGAATGLLAGVHPAIRAAKIEPAQALRAG